VGERSLRVLTRSDLLARRFETRAAAVWALEAALAEADAPRLSAAPAGSAAWPGPRSRGRTPTERA
jgi:hypothetical protein